MLLSQQTIFFNECALWLIAFVNLLETGTFTNTSTNHGISCLSTMNLYNFIIAFKLMLMRFDNTANIINDCLLVRSWK